MFGCVNSLGARRCTGVQSSIQSFVPVHSTMWSLSVAVVCAMLWPGAVQAVEPNKHSYVQIAQAVTLQVTPQIDATGGATVRLPIALSSGAPPPRSRIMLHQVPKWLTLNKGETVGAGVWLLPTTDAQALEGSVAPGTNASQRIGVSLIGADGQVLAETALSIRAGTVPSPPGVPVPPNVPAASVPNWQAMVGKQQPTVPSVELKSDPTPPAKAAAVAAPVIAKSGPPPAKATTVAGDEAQMVSQARFLVRECTTCHSLFGYDDGIPQMIGLTYDRFTDAMTLYKTGKRDHAAMKSVVDTLSTRDIQALALYLGRIRPPAAEEPRSARQSNQVVSGSSINLEKRLDAIAPDRLAKWSQRGEALVASGDIAEARLLLTRAAEYGSAQAAYVMGTSYDPNVLPWRPDRGVVAEPAKARDWYIYAQSLGAAGQVAERLADLGQK